jgi:catechol 2,3-dioxygenase-like lactoylglutathione lyase family enzyme
VTVLLLGYEDLPRARDYFVTVLGFEEIWPAEDDNGELSRSHVRLGDTILLLDHPGSHGIKSPAAADHEGYVFNFIE